MARPKGRFSKKVIKDARDVVSLKAQGWSDENIKTKFGWSAKEYKKRIQYLREARVFENEALGICQETIHRLKAIRDIAWQDYVKLKDDPKARNACVGSLRIVMECERGIIASGETLGIVKKNQLKKPENPEDVMAKKEEMANINLETMKDDELDRAYQAELQEADAS